MNQRERWLNYMRFKPVDRIPLMDMGLWDETFERWHHEGLPWWVTNLQQLDDYLQLDRSFNLNWLPVNDHIYPNFETRILDENETEYTIVDGRGVTLRQRKHDKTIPQFIRFPVENEADYERLLPHLNGKDAGRYPADFDEDIHWRHERGEIVGFNWTGFFGFPRDIMGLENWCRAFYEQPHLVKRIISDRVQFARDLLPRLLATGKLDFVQIWEDMAYKAGPLLSPRMVREFMLPAYAEIVALLRQGGVQLIMVDSDGRSNDLIPIWLEAGVDGTHPCEMAAGCDPFVVRQRNPRCCLLGGMDKRVLITGRAGIDAELKRIQPLLEQGAYVPMLDHFVPPNLSYADYLYYVDRRREILNRPWG